MADLTADEYRAGAKRALDAGDVATARKLIARGLALMPGTDAAQPAKAENVIAKTPDGGRVIQDGETRYFTSPNYSTSDPAQIAKIMEGATPADVSMAGFDEQTIAQAPVAARGSKFIQGVPFVGQYADEAIGATFGDRAMQGTRAVQGAMDRQHLIQSTALQVGGGIAGAIPMAIAAAPTIAASAPATLGGQVLAGASAGAIAGGIEGSISGVGAANDGDRAQGGLSGGLTGTAFGGAFGGAAPVMSRGIKTLIAKMKETDIAGIAKTLNISPKAAQILKADLEALDFGDAQKALTKSGPDAMLADAGISTREALDAAITGGGKASRIGVDAISTRAALAGKRLDTVMNAILGSPRGIKATAKSISQRTAPIRKAAYAKAYSSIINYASEAGRKIEDVLSRIPKGAMKSAIDEANDAMTAAGAKNMQILAEIAEDGSILLKEMPNVQQLDEIKKALGSVAAKEVDQHGIPTAAGWRAKDLARQLKTAVGEAVSSYNTAVKLGGDKIAERQALDMGRKLFGPATTREMVADTMSDASLEAKDAARQGIRDYLDDTLARVRRSVDDPSIDTTETKRLLDTISTRDAREKLVIVLGKDKAARLFAEIDAVGRQFGTRQAIATGSATGRRVARSRAVDDALAPGVVGTLQQGNPFESAGAVVRFLTRETPQAASSRRQEVLAEIATALTQIKGDGAKSALAAIQKSIDGQPLKDETAKMIANLLSGSTSLIGHQSGTRVLDQRRNAK